eukprot:747117-Hanusia_phi.AAC.10
MATEAFGALSLLPLSAIRSPPSSNLVLTCTDLFRTTSPPLTKLPHFLILLGVGDHVQRHLAELQDVRAAYIMRRAPGKDSCRAPEVQHNPGDGDVLDNAVAGALPGDEADSCDYHPCDHPGFVHDRSVLLLHGEARESPGTCTDPLRRVPHLEHDEEGEEKGGKQDVGDRELGDGNCPHESKAYC